MDTLIIGALLGGSYALMAVGLQLQYGVARIMNLASGEILVAGAYGAFWFYSGYHLSPLITALALAPVAFAANWAIYRLLLLPLVRRAKSEGHLEVDSILATFGISFILVGTMLAAFGGELFSYSYLERPVVIFGETYALNRLVAFLYALALSAGLYLWLYRTRTGLTMRAVSVSPGAAGLVGIDVRATSALAFGLGGAVSAAGGGLLSTFLPFDPSIGIVFTMKALVVVILGGVRDIRGSILAAFILGITETVVSSWIDPGLTLAAAYLLFLLILLFRPQGLLGRKAG